MNIKCPISSMKAAKTQIALGATELYMGAKTDNLVNLTYGGRGKTTWKGKDCTVDVDELKDIVKYAHENGIKVSYTANMPIMYQELISNYLKYVEIGVDAGVDSLIIGSIESILLLNKYVYPVKYIASVFTECYNLDFLHWLEQMNISEVYLPHQLRLSEIKEISDNTAMDIGVFAHFGCSNSNGACFLYHESGEDINVGLPCRGLYSACHGSSQLKASNYLDAGADCSICAVKDLYHAGVSSLKIVGRGKDLALIGALTKIYKMAVDSLDCEISNSELRDAAIKLMPSLRTDNCELKRCKYIVDTPINKSFV